MSDMEGFREESGKIPGRFLEDSWKDGVEPTGILP